MAEKYQEDNSETQQQNHNEYLKIIDDLSCELNTLSRQVNMVQRDFPTDEITKQFEGSLRVLETQNDLLQTAVESLMEERETIERTLQTQNEDLKNILCQREDDICALRRRISEFQQRPCEKCLLRTRSDRAQQRVDGERAQRTDSVEEIRALECELRKRTKAVEGLRSENSRLVEDLQDIQRNQAKMKLMQKRDRARSEERTNEQDVMAKLTTLQERNKDQYKSLQKASKEIYNLQQEIERLRTDEELFIKERDLLRTELIALKESQASQLGIEQSLREQLDGTVTELYVAKEKLYECIQEKNRIENIHRDETKRNQALSANIYQKYSRLVEEFNMILEEYQKVVRIEKEKTNQINAFKAWKEQQVEVEKNWRSKMQLLENHVKEMLEDNQNLIDRLSQTEHDNRTLLDAMEQSKLYSMCNQSMSFSSPSRGYPPVGNNDPVSKVIENVRMTSRRLSQQKCALEDEEKRFLQK